MTKPLKIVVEPLEDRTATEIGAKRTTAKRQRVTDSNGNSKLVWAIDLDSQNFQRDLTYVFGRNVAQARRENKKLTGSPDGIVKK